MMALRCCGLLAACAAIAALSLPSATMAKGGGGAALMAFSLRGSDGYALQVIAIAPRLVVLSASKGNVAASYVVRGSVSQERVKARFGNLGRISVRFRPRRQPNAAKRCDPRANLVQTGTFRGTIRFAGERGYTKARSRRASGIALGASVPGCEGKGGRPGQGAKRSATPPRLTTNLTAITKRKGRTVSVGVRGVGRSARVTISASVQERRGKMEVARAASALVGGPNAFLSSDPGERPAFALLRPPKPFGGTGVFEEGARLSNSWTGSLSAWLPGAGKVSLAGTTFASSFCRKAPSSGCDPFPPVRRMFDQGNGSHSQDLLEERLSWSRYLLNSASSAGSTP